MKILFVIDAFLSHSNGTSISAQRYGETLRSFGHEVKVLTNAEKPYPDYIFALKEAKTPIDGLLHANGYQFAAPDEKIIDTALDWCDIVHVFTPFMLGCKVKKMALSKGKPITAAFHVQAENISSGFRVGKVEFINRLLYRLHYHTMYKGIKLIHCPSQMMADELKHYGFDNDLRVISNGISDDFVYYRPANEANFPGKIVITMVGRLSPEKRQDLLIKAVKMSKYEKQIQLQFAGVGSIEKYYRKLGKELTNEPVFGYYTREELINLLHDTHLYVHASDMESEAIGCIEAFATGLVPIISNSPLSATKQFALDERSLFEVGNAASLKDKIEYWIEHPEERQEMEVKYAQEAEKYRLTKAVRQFEAMLKEAME
ncbi:MAG: glycosyltransferase [Paludibacteraceae bacterium]|nr:glycosyltransferase [Paludibacteraceae bacterium]